MTVAGMTCCYPYNWEDDIWGPNYCWSWTRL